MSRGLFEYVYSDANGGENTEKSTDRSGIWRATSTVSA